MRYLLLLLFAACSSAEATIPTPTAPYQQYSNYIYDTTSGLDAGLSTGTLYTKSSCINIYLETDAGFVASDATISEILADGTVVGLYNSPVASTGKLVTSWGRGCLTNSGGTLTTANISTIVPPEISITTKPKAGGYVRLAISQCQ